MNYYSQDPLPEESRLTVSSLILLTIFVSAVVVVIYLSLTRPWAGDDEAIAPVVEEPIAEESAGEEVLEGGAGTGDEVALEPAR